jgi:hypothetical protein
MKQFLICHQGGVAVMTPMMTRGCRARGWRPEQDWGLAGFELSGDGGLALAGSSCAGVRVVDTATGAVVLHGAVDGDPVTQQVAWSDGAASRAVFLSSGSAGAVWLWGDGDGAEDEA